MYLLKLEIKCPEQLTLGFLYIFSQALPIAEIAVLSGNSFLHCGPLRDISLAIGVLDKLLWLHFSVRSLVRNEHISEEIGENAISDNE